MAYFLGGGMMHACSAFISCSTQLSVKFIMFVNVKMAKTRYKFLACLCSYQVGMSLTWLPPQTGIPATWPIWCWYSLEEFVWDASNTTTKLSRDIRFPTMWYVWPAKAQISLRICAVWSEPLLVAWLFYKCSATDRTSFGVSKLSRRLHRLVGVYSCQNATLLEVTCRSSNVFMEKYGPRREKTCLRGFRKSEIQTSLLSYRD